MKLGEYSGNILGEQYTAIVFHLHVLTSPDWAAIVEENLHLISDRTMVTSANMQVTDEVGSTPQNSGVDTGSLLL